MLWYYWQVVYNNALLYPRLRLQVESESIKKPYEEEKTAANLGQASTDAALGAWVFRVASSDLAGRLKAAMQQVHAKNRVMNGAS